MYRHQLLNGGIEIVWLVLKVVKATASFSVARWFGIELAKKNNIKKGER